MDNSLSGAAPLGNRRPFSFFIFHFHRATTKWPLRGRHPFGVNGVSVARVEKRLWVKGVRGGVPPAGNSSVSCRLPSSPGLPGRIEAPVSGAIGEWPPGASIRLRWCGATRQPAAFSPFLFYFSFFLFHSHRADQRPGKVELLIS